MLSVQPDLWARPRPGLRQLASLRGGWLWRCLYPLTVQIAITQTKGQSERIRPGLFVQAPKREVRVTAADVLLTGSHSASLSSGSVSCVHRSPSIRARTVSPVMSRRLRHRECLCSRCFFERVQARPPSRGSGERFGHSGAPHTATGRVRHIGRSSQRKFFRRILMVASICLQRICDRAFCLPLQNISARDYRGIRSPSNRVLF